MDSLTKNFNRQANILIFLFWIFIGIDFSKDQEKRRRKRNLRLSREFNEKAKKKSRENYSRQVAERHMPRSYRLPVRRF